MLHIRYARYRYKPRKQRVRKPTRSNFTTLHVQHIWQPVVVREFHCRDCEINRLVCIIGAWRGNETKFYTELLEGERFHVAVFGQRAFSSVRFVPPVQNAIQLLDNLSNGISATCASLQRSSIPNMQFRRAIRQTRKKSGKLFINASIFQIYWFLFIHRKFVLEGNELVRWMREICNRMDERVKITLENYLQFKEICEISRLARVNFRPTY